MAAEAKVYAMDDFYWWAATSRESAIASFIAEMEKEQLEEWDSEEVTELDEEEMQSLFYHADDARITFKEQLQRMMAAGEQFPCMFASTEF
jgi:hypothetical protein